MNIEFLMTSNNFSKWTIEDDRCKDGGSLLDWQFRQGSIQDERSLSG